MGFENGKLVRVTMRASTSTTEQVNTFHYDLDDSGGQGSNDPQLLADFFRDTVVPPFRGMYDAQWTIDPPVVIQEKDPQNPFAGRSEWVSGTPLPGTRVNTGEGYGIAHCAVCTLKTEHIGRRHTGRLFLGGSLAEGDVTFSTWSAGAVAVWQAFVNAIPRQPDLVAGASAAVAHWCVYSRTQRAADLDPYASKIVAATIHNRVHWLRSRDD